MNITLQILHKNTTTCFKHTKKIINIGFFIALFFY